MNPKDSATPKVDEAPDTDVKQDQGNNKIDELVTPGARVQRAQSESSKERMFPVASVKDVEDEESDDEEEMHEEPARVALNPVPVPTEAIKGTTFGLKKDKMSGRRKEKELKEPDIPSPYDYTRKYPRDKRYEELHDDSRVWLAYNDEAAIFDNDMIGEAADSLDILLVFAGLFSAVLTTFVAQTSQSLSPDNAAITVSLLTELVAVQRAGLTNSSISSIAPAEVAPAIARTDVWVNALWFTSLALSLASALLAVLSKQWLRQYLSFISGTARERALIRQFRYDGMEKWAVRTIIGLLPTLLHLALGLFLAGLVVFLAPLQRGIAASVGTISGALFVAYAASIIIAIVHVESPYRTTFSDILSTTLRWMFTVAYTFFQTRLALREIKIAPTARAAEQRLAVCLDEDPGATQACTALLWLHNTTGSMSAKTLIMYSLGAFPPRFFDGDEQQAIFIQLSNGCGPDYHAVHNWRDNIEQKTAHEFELMLRILAHATPTSWRYISIDNIRDYLESDVGLTVACAAFEVCPPPQIENNASEEGRTTKHIALRGLFSVDASDILSALPLNYSSYQRILESLGSAPPVVWSNLTHRCSWLGRLSPRDLDNWPSDKVDLRKYLDLIKAAQKNQPAQSPSVFQNPVGFLSFLQPIFKNLGWYDISPYAFRRFRYSVPPHLNDTVDNEDDGDLMGDSPPPDNDAVWEAAVYPEEWPPLPDLTHAGELKAVEAQWKAWEVKKARREAKGEAKREAEREAEEKEAREREGRFGSKFRKLVREKLRGAKKSAWDTDIEMQQE